VFPHPAIPRVNPDLPGDGPGLPFFDKAMNEHPLLENTGGNDGSSSSNANPYDNSGSGGDGHNPGDAGSVTNTNLIPHPNPHNIPVGGETPGSAISQLFGAITSAPLEGAVHGAAVGLFVATMMEMAFFGLQHRDIEVFQRQLWGRVKYR
jgi:hypothetical protein